MKITIDIPDANAPTVIQFLATILAQAQTPDAVTDPAPNHPELPLEVMEDAVVIEQEPPFAVEPAEVEVKPEDPTQLEVPIPDNAPPLPELPEGKTRWIGRGRFEGKKIDGNRRQIKYWLASDDRWTTTYEFSLSPFHIEAI